MKRMTIWLTKRAAAAARRTALVVVGLAVGLGAARVHATAVGGVTASTNMGSGFDTNIQNTVNGAGLLSDGLTALHGPTLPNNSWVSQGTLTGTISFDLGSPLFINSFSFWNQNAGGPGAEGSTGIRNVTVETSLDGLAFALLNGGPSQFARVTLGQGRPPEIFNFPTVLARHVRFVVASNYGDLMQTGFAEVKFNSTVPEPSALLLAGTAAAAAVALHRRGVRRRRAVTART